MPQVRSTLQLQRWGLTVSAQSLSSVTNFIATALALSAGDLAAFGRFAITFQLCVLLISIGHGSVGVAVLVHLSGADDAETSPLRSGAATAALLLGTAFGVVVALAIPFVGADMRTLLLIAAVGGPALVAQYTLRSTLYAASNPKGVVKADGTWLAVLLAVAAAYWLFDWDATPTTYLVAWVAGAAVSARSMIVLGLTRGWRHLGEFWTVTGVQAARLGVDDMLGRVVFVGSLVATEIVVGAAASGALAAAVVVFSPLTIAHTSTTALVVPAEVRAHGVHVVRRRIPLLIFASIAVITTGWAGAVAALNATDLPAGPFDLTANGISTALFLATLSRYVAMGFWRGATVGLRIADAAKPSLESRVVGTVAELGLLVVGLHLGGLDVGAMGLALGTWIGGAATWQRFLALDPGRT